MTTSFDQIAIDYDLQMGENGDFNHQYAIDPALFELINLENLAKIEKPKIYDLGCGNGYLSRFLANKFPDSQIFASDISVKLIEIAKKKPSKIEKTQDLETANSDKNSDQTINSKFRNEINYFVADGSNFDYFAKTENGTFDLIYANMSLHYIQNLISLSEGILRLLKTGGKLVFTTSHPFGDLKLFSEKNKNEFTKTQMVKIAQDYWQNQTFETFFGDFPLTIHKRSISFYVNFFVNDFKLEKMLEIPKMKLVDGKIVNTQIPAYYGLSSVKL